MKRSFINLFLKRPASSSLPVIILAFFLLMGGCGGSKDWSKGRNGPFQSVESGLNPSYRLYHSSSDSSVLFFRVQHGQLLYTRNSASAPFVAELKVKVRVKSKNGRLIRSDSAFVRDEGKGDEGNSIGRLPIRWEGDAKEGRLEILAHDTRRDRKATHRIFFDRKGLNSRQNFLPVHPKSKRPYFRSYFPSRKRIGIRYERSDVDQLHVRAYSRKFPLPPPPFASDAFSSFDEEADSLFTFSQNSDHYFEATVPDSGFFHLQVDTSAGLEGFTYFHFREGYPKVSTVEAMLDPIRYLTSEKEFERLKAKSDIKAAVDSFWVDKGGSHERARKLIEAYYGRVETANRYFTSYVEGWKTDRGLIHIIFGDPESVQRTSSGEKWIYGDRDGKMRLRFEFERVENPFTNKDMSLDRSNMYKRPWYQAVESWRKGRIHSY